MHRILKPGGRLAFSDFVARKPMSKEMKEDPELLAGCVSGAIEREVLEGYLTACGFAGGFTPAKGGRGEAN